MLIKSWSTVSVPGVSLDPKSMCAPGQICPTVGEILKQYGVNPVTSSLADADDDVVYDDVQSDVPIDDIDDYLQFEGNLDFNHQDAVEPDTGKPEPKEAQRSEATKGDGPDASGSDKS